MPLSLFMKAGRVKFAPASASPVIAGTALALAMGNKFDPLLFTLALLGIIFIHIASNMFNDYFDHLSGNDWYNQNYTDFSGGSRTIQLGMVSPKSVLMTAILCTAIGSLAGIVILYLTKSLFILTLALAGVSGAYFYSARPFKFAYRGFGEILIFFLFGVAPVYGAYFLQSKTIDAAPAITSIMIGLLIFTLLVINEIPDRVADEKAKKKTLVVQLGVKNTILLVRVSLVCVYLAAIVGLVFLPYMRIACALTLLTIPLVLRLSKLLTEEQIQKPNNSIHSELIVKLHSMVSIALTLGFLSHRLFNN